jgi:hypothetical protein
VVAKQRPNNARGEWSRVTTIVVSKINANINAMTRCMMREKNA